MNTNKEKADLRQIILHYRRNTGDYDGWGLHVWGPTPEFVTWESPLSPSGRDEFGIYWKINVYQERGFLGFVIHKGDQKDTASDRYLEIYNETSEWWLAEGIVEKFSQPSDGIQALFVSKIGDFSKFAKAYWLASDTIVWPGIANSIFDYFLHFNPDSRMEVSPKGVLGGEKIPLKVEHTGPRRDLAEKYPHLSDALVLRVPEPRLTKVPELLRGQVGITAVNSGGEIIAATALQIQGVLDELYAYRDALGVSFSKEGAPTLRLWAPTAKIVTLHLYAEGNSPAPYQSLAMEMNPQTGVWTATGDPSWDRKYYLFEVEVYVRERGKLVRNLVTDPYSVNLSTNSLKSQIVDLAGADLKPTGWDEVKVHGVTDPTDMVIYELHLRDFSSTDPTVPEAHRGTYLAFTNPSSRGMQHLQRLAHAGVTHIQLMPIFDFATINEDRSAQVQPDFDLLSRFPADSEEQQKLVCKYKDQDGYNWGYDPYHFFAPEGSYAKDPDGKARIVELRKMVMSLHEMGLKVVMDVVYNHTFKANQSRKSVLDRIVPGYYHRLDHQGEISTSTCCPNTASENVMMEKLIIDSILLWAKEYKIAGFRFDLMGHHMISNMQKIRAALDQLTIEEDGVAGKGIYLYGEGWDFGEVAGNARGVNAAQKNLPGTGVGSFNDRIRNAVRGGGPFYGITEQGFITGLYTDTNQSSGKPLRWEKSHLHYLSDVIRLSLVGNLAEFRFVTADGSEHAGRELKFQGAPAGYTQAPQENVIYISAHDNETLFDAIQLKAPSSASLDERVRIQNLGISLVALGQGIPFFHAGCEILRSKSLDRNSYDSGDWFNRLDFSYQHNNWGSGLPPYAHNKEHWPLMKTLLSQSKLKPGKAQILATCAHFEEMLQIRMSSPLFRLRSAAEIQKRVSFHNTGPNQVPGLIFMSIADFEEDSLDHKFDYFVVIFNADKNPHEVKFPKPVLKVFHLHPVQSRSADPLVLQAKFDLDHSAFSVPGRTTAVFASTRSGNQHP